MRSPRIHLRSAAYVAAVVMVLSPLSAFADTSDTPENANMFPEPIFVSLQKSGAVEKLPSKAVYKGFPQAHYLDLGPDRDTLVISGFKTGQVYIADAHTGEKQATLQLGKVVQGVKVAPSGNYAVAVNASGGTLDVIDLQTDKMTNSIPVGRNPHNVRFSPHGRLAYVTLQGEDAIAVVNMLDREKVREIPVPGLDGAHNLDLSHDGRRLWVRSHPPKASDVGHVVMIDLASGKMNNSLAVGHFHGGIDLNPANTVALATDIGDDTVDVMDRNALTVEKHVHVGAGPHGVRFSPGGDWAYASDTRANEVAVIDMKTLKVERRISMDGKFPFWIALAGNE